MAYMRGVNYVYNDGHNIHFNEIQIHNSIMDEYVVMRYAEMTNKQISRIEKRALKKHLGNFGCDGLAKKNGKPTVIEQLKTVLKRKK